MELHKSITDLHYRIMDHHIQSCISIITGIFFPFRTPYFNYDSSLDSGHGATYWIDWSVIHLEILIVRLWISITDLSTSIYWCDSSWLIIPYYGQHFLYGGGHISFWKSIMNYISPQMIMDPISYVRWSILMRLSPHRQFIPTCWIRFCILKAQNLASGFHTICKQSGHLEPLSDRPNIISHTEHGHRIRLHI